MLTQTLINSFYPITVSVSKYGGICNFIDNPCAQVCVLNKVKKINVKVFNLMSGVHEAKVLVQHKTCECKCRLNESVRSSKQK